jgi:hypothetical protein
MNDKKRGSLASPFHANIGRPTGILTNHIPLGRIRPNSVLNISYVMTFRSSIPKRITPEGGFLWPFRNCQSRNVIVDVKDKQQTVIEFLPLEKDTGDEIMMCLRNVCGSVAHCCASVFRWISGNEELRNDRHPGRPYSHETSGSRNS